MKVLGRLLRPASVREFNRALRSEAEMMKPQLFIAVKGAFVTRETLEVFRRSGIVTYCFYPDVSFTAHGRYLHRSLPMYDWIFTTKSFGPKDLRERFGIGRASFLPHAYDPAVHQPREATPELLRQLGAEVSFIGSWSPKKQRLLEELMRRRPKLKLRIWGNSWTKLPRHSSLREFTSFKPIVGIGYASAISCSKVNLGILSEQVDGASSGDLITSRTFHIPACGGLMLHERTSDLLAIFKEGESCVCFDDPDELVTKVDELLADDSRRKAIADCGRRVVNAGHSWDHRARTILEHYFTSLTTPLPKSHRERSTPVLAEPVHSRSRN